MKKTTLILALLGMAAIATAQKNSVIVLGNIGYNIRGTDDTGGNNGATSNFVFNPAVGYQVSDKWALGIVGGLQQSWGRGHVQGPPPVHVKNSTATMEVGVFARYTLPVTDMFFVAIQNELVYSTSSSNNNGIRESGLQNGVSLNVYPNLGIRIKNGYAVNLSFGSLTAGYSKDKAGASGYSVNTSLGRGVMFGFTKNFVSHKKTATEAKG